MKPEAYRMQNNRETQSSVAGNSSFRILHSAFENHYV